MTPGHSRTVRFRYDHGERVRRYGHDEPGEIVQQRVTFRAILGPVIDYAVQDTAGVVHWEYEADLEPVEEKTP